MVVRGREDGVALRASQARGGLDMCVSVRGHCQQYMCMLWPRALYVARMQSYCPLRA